MMPSTPTTPSTPATPGPGNPAPPFTLPSSGGGDVSLSDYLGRRLVLYFYPRADTPGCTTQACGFRDAAGDYTAAGVAVVGVSPDPLDDVRTFADKFSLNFPLLADADHAVCERYGVWREKVRFGRASMGVSRTTFVIDSHGRIVHVFEDVRPEGHEREVLKVIDSVA